MITSLTLELMRLFFVFIGEAEGGRLVLTGAGVHASSACLLLGCQPWQGAAAGVEAGRLSSVQVSHVGGRIPTT